MPPMEEEFVCNLPGRGFFSPVGEEPYEVEYDLNEYQSYLRDGRSYEARGKTEWRGTISPLRSSIAAPSGPHRLKLGEGTILNCFVKADRTVLCNTLTE
jgi:hypothetical protein